MMLVLGRLRCTLAGILSQSNSLPRNVPTNSHSTNDYNQQVSRTMNNAKVFHCRFLSFVHYTTAIVLQVQAEVKLNRVFLPRRGFILAS